MEIDVAFLPKNIEFTDLTDTICIVLDVFRATSSIVTAIANGCKTIVPVSSIDNAYKFGEQKNFLLFAGERQSIKIKDFDFGNSPLEFFPDVVRDRTIIMTTTNGTNAIEATEKSYITLIGSFINAEAVCRQAKKYQKNILIVCAGTDQLFSLEDALCAGLLVDILHGEKDYFMTDAANGAWLMYNGAKETLVESAGNSRNGRRLHNMSCEVDIEYCLNKNIVNVVPQYKNGTISLIKESSNK